MCLKWKCCKHSVASCCWWVQPTTFGPMRCHGGTVPSFGKWIGWSYKAREQRKLLAACVYLQLDNDFNKVLYIMRFCLSLKLRKKKQWWQCCQGPPVVLLVTLSPGNRCKWTWTDDDHRHNGLEVGVQGLFSNLLIDLCLSGYSVSRFITGSFLNETAQNISRPILF